MDDLNKMTIEDRCAVVKLCRGDRTFQPTLCRGHSRHRGAISPIGGRQGGRAKVRIGHANGGGARATRLAGGGEVVGMSSAQDLALGTYRFLAESFSFHLSYWEIEDVDKVATRSNQEHKVAIPPTRGNDWR